MCKSTVLPHRQKLFWPLSCSVLYQAKKYSISEVLQFLADLVLSAMHVQKNCIPLGDTAVYIESVQSSA